MIVPDGNTIEPSKPGGFEFGKNWSKLVPQLEAEHLESAVQDIVSFVGRDSLAGMSFLDIGSGSGLHSLAAYHLGAAPIISVDIDPLNIENLERLRKQYAVPEGASWQGWRSDITNSDDLAKLPMADLVYSWGVLHHTGRMWQAIDNAASRVNPGGLFFIMLYRDAVLAGAWTAVKKVYIRMPSPLQWLMEAVWASFLFVGMILRGRNPVRVIRDYPKNGRGMTWWIGIADWIGGYPFEYAGAQETIDFMRQRGFELVKVEDPAGVDPYTRPFGIRGTGSICYLFKRSGSPAPRS